MKKSVVIFGRSIPVIQKKNLLKETSQFGYYDYEKLEIAIDADLPPKVAYETLIHECGHALFHRAGLGQTKISQDIEHVIVEQFSIMMSENFRNK